MSLQYTRIFSQFTSPTAAKMRKRLTAEDCVGNFAGRLTASRVFLGGREV